MMNIAIKALGFKPFLISNEIPEGLTGYHIPGSKIISAVATFGKFLLQIAEFDDYGWLYCVFDLETEVTFLLTYFIPLIIARISLQGDFQYEAKQIGNLLVKENQFNIFYDPTPDCLIHFKEGKHISFEVIYAQKNVLQILNFFPAFGTFKKNIQASTPSILSNADIHITASITECIYKIIHSPYSKNVQQFHVGIIKELLIKMLKQASHLHTFNKKFALDEIERIYAAKEFIDLNVPRHFSISQIARHVGINIKKLKQGFKEIFGIGLYGYLQEQIFEIARAQVEQTIQPIQEIGLNAGYNTANNFSTAFKKRFGLTPLEWREQFNNNRKTAE